jgi:ATP-binding cassette subfamily B protein
MRYYHASGVDAESARIDRAVIRRAWRFVRPYRGMLLLYLACIALLSVLGVLPPLIFKQILDEAIPSRDHGAVNVLALAAVGVALLTTGLGLLNRWFGARVGEGLIFDLRVALYRHVQGMPLAFFTRTQTGALMSRLSTDVIGAQNTIATLATVILNVLQLVTTLAVMVLLSWQATALALLVLPFFLLLDRRLGRRLKYLARRRMQENAGMSAMMTERFNVAGALLVKLFGRPEQESAEFAARAAEVRDSGVLQALTGRILFAALGLIGAVGTAGVYWLGARSVISGGLETGTVVALVAYVQRLYQPLTDLAGARVDVLTAMVSFERVFEVLDAPQAITEAPGAVPLVRPRGEVEFEDVWFRYPAGATVSIASLEADSTVALGDDPSAWVLKGVSFRAEPGSLVALVGPSGAGKTTLSMLVPRMYDVVSGRVLLDGHDVRELTLQSVADAVGVVTQDPHLFHDSMASNLRYAKPDATDEELVAACRAARIHDLIASLPEGYDTVVGERGYRLSGGEKQRLAIARVLLKDPAVVILDEATAHLDSETEALVQQALATALEGRTSLVIAHRLSTIRAADEILVLDGGRIVERGTHDELVAVGGPYAELYETQYLPGATA